MPFEVGITWPVMSFTFGVALTVGIVFGLSPALHATRLGLASALRDSSITVAASRGRLQRGLVVAQIALTQPLIVMLAAVLLFVVAQLQPRAWNDLGDRMIAVSVRPTSPIRGSSVPASSTSAGQCAAATATPARPFRQPRLQKRAGKQRTNTRRRRRPRLRP